MPKRELEKMTDAPKTVLMPLPAHDCDPTEVAISWKVLRQRGIDVCFATPEGRPATTDPVMFSGQGLDPWGRVPGLRRLPLLGLLLRARQDARQAWRQMEQDTCFKHPVAYKAIQSADYQALLLPGGHAPGMRVYQESTLLQQCVVDFFKKPNAQGQQRPVAAICHGVLLAARSIDPDTQRSVLYGRKTTALTWGMERSAWDLTRYYGRLWDRNYYRTYVEGPTDPAGYWSVEAEVRRSLQRNEDFIDVPAGGIHHWLQRSGLLRDRANDDRFAWVVQDGRYLSARWPGDVYTFASRFADMLSTEVSDGFEVQNQTG